MNMTAEYSHYAGRKRAYTSGEFKPAWRSFGTENGAHQGDMYAGGRETILDRLQAIFHGESDISLTAVLTLVVTFMFLTAGGILMLTA